MQAIDHPRGLISWRAAFIGGMCGVGVLTSFAAANYISGYWLMFLTGTPIQQINATLRDPTSLWLLSVGGCIEVGGALLAGFVSVRAGAATRIQALVAGFLCLAYEILTLAYPGASPVPHWVLALAAVELIVGSMLGGVLAGRSKFSIQKGHHMTVAGNLVKGLRTIGRGFLLGIGFTLVFGAFLVVAELMVKRQVENMSQGREHAGATPEAKIKNLELVDVEEHRSGDRDYIIGTIRNNGADTVQNIEIEADLFLAGKFVDKYSTDESNPLAAGATAYFKIECGCKNSAPAEHDSFKAHIVSVF
jgi:hypothetical protein